MAYARKRRSTSRRSAPRRSTRSARSAPRAYKARSRSRSSSSSRGRSTARRSAPRRQVVTLQILQAPVPSAGMDLLAASKKEVAPKRARL